MVTRVQDGQGSREREREREYGAGVCERGTPLRQTHRGTRSDAGQDARCRRRSAKDRTRRDQALDEERVSRVTAAQEWSASMRIVARADVGRWQDGQAGSRAARRLAMSFCFLDQPTPPLFSRRDDGASYAGEHEREETHESARVGASRLHERARAAAREEPPGGRAQRTVRSVERRRGSGARDRLRESGERGAQEQAEYEPERGYEDHDEARHRAALAPPEDLDNDDERNGGSQSRRGAGRRANARPDLRSAEHEPHGRAADHHVHDVGRDQDEHTTERHVHEPEQCRNRARTHEARRDRAYQDGTHAAEDEDRR